MSPPSVADRAAFIAAHTTVFPVPNAPELRLHLAGEATALWQKTEEELGEIGLPPPFWAFAWAGGQALARYILDNPGLVAGRRVLDFASGSGLVAVAAARAGAAKVEAADIDVFAVTAIGLNAALNGAVVAARDDDVLDLDEGWDVVLAGDICYERDLAARVIAWLTVLAGRGATVLIGDPGRSYLPRERLRAVASYDIAVTRELEDSEIKHTSVWRLADG
ncbi:class I SAM-dependent methyltransferase [Chelatococcus reniformis]|uniref:50S ribosomal protein L11 methyltransferase n=1 Tax=Chelatococcus reniformis TaxID=1494448 RepID=A0A916UXC0_9HYPH|nr:methyltransferase [Chelatococcus reniformis]GGC93001.1 50S ribosomal protein L11 methyltransferase [Chelatococcus reniformis]